MLQRPHRELLTFHERGVGAAVVVKVPAVQVVQAVISQAVCVAETLKDAVHEALQETQQQELMQHPWNSAGAQKLHLLPGNKLLDQRRHAALNSNVSPTLLIHLTNKQFPEKSPVAPDDGSKTSGFLIPCLRISSWTLCTRHVTT